MINREYKFLRMETSYFWKLYFLDVKMKKIEQKRNSHQYFDKKKPEFEDQFTKSVLMLLINSHQFLLLCLKDITI